MIKGLYKSASGMIPRIAKQELIANNIANVGTAGFKKDRLFTKELSRAELRTTKKQADWQEPLADKLHVDFSQSSFDRTESPLDLAIEGDGFFRIQDDTGQTYLTRTGTFSVDSQGFIAYPGGHRLMGDGGPIQVGAGAVTIGATGEVSVDGDLVGRVVPVVPNRPEALVRVGASLFRVPNSVSTSASPNASIQQGYLEQANVDVITEMVDMMASYRTYEANAKALQTQDGTLEQLFQRVAPRGR